LAERAVFWLVGVTGSLLIRIIGFTLRVTGPDRSLLSEAQARYGRVIFSIWHGQIFLGTYFARYERISAIISQHRDGEFIYQIARRLGIKAVRGSSTRGGASAILELLTSPEHRSYNICVIPDGPRGPAEKVKPGIIRVAGILGLPVIPVAMVPSSAWEMGSWDRFQVPRPFSRVVVLLGRAIWVDRDDDEAAMERTRGLLEEELNALNREARRQVLFEGDGGPTKVMSGGERFYLTAHRYLYRERELWWSLPLTFLLFVPERAYRLWMGIRNLFFKMSVLRSRHLPVPVISVGNLSMGGTGKTMMVRMLSGILSERGFRVAVLTRGYGGSRENDVSVVTAKATAMGASSGSADESILLAHTLSASNVIVIEGKDRFMAGLLAVMRCGCDICLLDDGFQHRRLYRDLDVVMLHGERPFGTGRTLPAGSLREGIGNLKRADLIVNCRRWRRDASGKSEWDKTPNGLPQLRVSIVPDMVYPLEDPRLQRDITALNEKVVLAFSGIGDPWSFRKLVEEGGPRCMEFIAFPDHCRYTRGRLERLFRVFDHMRADLMVTTEKDAAKLRRDDVGGRPCLVVSTKLVIDEGEEVLEEFLGWLDLRRKSSGISQEKG
jgi:tetraacyldisaccharide 4'-kinase